jgi:hypothetical protein
MPSVNECISQYAVPDFQFSYKHHYHLHNKAF